MSADLVLTDGRIYTVDPANAVAEAMAVRDGRVLATGSTEEIRGLAGPAATVRSLGGRTIVPGIIDSHVHLLAFGLSLRTVDLRGIDSVELALAAVSEAAKRTMPGRWIEGNGWDRNLFGRLPTRQELDRVAPANPVFLASKDLHSLWVNTAALELAGIGPDSENPADGEIVRDASGLPSGVLREGARTRIFQAVPSPSEQECRDAIAHALGISASKGLTGLQTFESGQTFRALQRLRADGALPIRVCCHLWRDGFDHAEALAMRTGFGDEWLRLGHLKLFLDGALGSRTALMLEPYSGSDGKGIQTMEQQELVDVIARAARSGIAVAIHAIGDAANRLAIDALEETEPIWKPTGLRQRIEHVQLLADGDAERLSRLGVIASMQPIHATADWEVAERHWAGRTRLAYAWNTVLQEGAPLAFGSDCPVEPIDPLLGLHAAVTRQTADGKPHGGWHPEQRLSPIDALRAFTIGAAFSSGEEGNKGSLEHGKLADFVVLSDNPFAGPPELLLTTRVEATVVAGRVVYGEI